MNLYYKLKLTIKKLLKQKINIVFICHRPQVWGALDSVFHSCNDDKQFNVTIVAIPNKKQLPKLGLVHEIYETEGAEEFFKDFPCKVINGYDYQTKKWFNLKKLKPDYVFFQQPYNITRPKKYLSKNVSKYAKILYVHYASNMIGNGILEESYPIDFIKHVDTIFVQDKYDQVLINNFLKKNQLKTKTLLTGYPKYDENIKLKNITDSNNWNFKKEENKFRIIWTPRWCTNEENCNFFEYKDKLLNFVENNTDVDFIFRPHPQAFLEWNATGELPEKEANIYKNKYDKLPNAKIDTEKEYLKTFHSSDVLITDISSIVAEYFLTGKPIIYCHKTDCFNDFSRTLSKGFYWVHNWEDLESTINMLKRGEDPLQEIRKEIIQTCFYINPNGAGNTIKDIIKEDFIKTI